LIDDIIRKPWGKQGVFGATEKRFVGEKKMVTPGPGNYNPLQSLVMLQQKSEANIKRCSSMFLSSQLRDPKKAIAQAPPPGEYEVNQYDIATQVKKNAEAGANNPAIANLKMKRGDKGVFISG